MESLNFGELNDLGPQLFHNLPHSANTDNSLELPQEALDPRLDHSEEAKKNYFHFHPQIDLSKISNNQSVLSR